jgi:NDP-sugar pyrophosphorylase family protein
METKDHIEQYINQRFVEKDEDDEEIMYMGNKTFVLTDEFIEQDGEKLYQVKYKKAYSYKYGNSTYGVAEGTVGGYVSKKAFIGENVTIGPNVKVPQYCVLAKGTVVTESIPPFTKSFEEDFCITKLTLLDLNKDPYAINEDRIVI